MTTASQRTLDVALRRIDELEERVAQLERRGIRTRGEGGASTDLAAAEWTSPYEPAELAVSETWIELHEHSARPQLQRLIREVVEAEGPVTERLVIDRIRRAWGLRRAGGRVQEAIDQAIRQLLARGLVERTSDSLHAPGADMKLVRVPGSDERSRRAAEDVPLVELAEALGRAARTLGPCEESELTMSVAKLFGWTRRGGSIQERLDAALAQAVASGDVLRDGGSVRSGGVDATATSRS